MNFCMNVVIPHWVVHSQLQGQKLKASLISAYRQCNIITVSTFTAKKQPENMTFLGSAFCVLLSVLLLVRQSELYVPEQSVGCGLKQIWPDLTEHRERKDTMEHTVHYIYINLKKGHMVLCRLRG